MNTYLIKNHYSFNGDSQSITIQAETATGAFNLSAARVISEAVECGSEFNHMEIRAWPTGGELKLMYIDEGNSEVWETITMELL